MRSPNAMGDASGLRVVDTPSGRIGSLICWENYTPLARFALYAQGCEVYIAPTWDAGSSWVSTMRHIALEGWCWVLGIGSAMRGKDMPADFPQRAKMFRNLDEWFNPDDSVIVAPDGSESRNKDKSNCRRALQHSQRALVKRVG